MPFSPQHLTHRGVGVCLCHGIEVAVDVGGGAMGVKMSEEESV